MKAFEPFSAISFFVEKPSICDACKKSFGRGGESWKVGNVSCEAIYPYSQTIRSVIYQFKGCHDYELRTVFLEGMHWYYRLRFHGYVIVPVPSYAAHDEARGFNHVYEIFSQIGLPMVKAIKKNKDIKQASLGRRKRKQVKHALELIKPKFVTNKKILLVDDVYTTGSTIKACINLLQKAKPRTIHVLVLAKVDRHKNDP